MPQPSYLNVISQGCYNILTRQNISWTTRLPNAARDRGRKYHLWESRTSACLLFILNYPKECWKGLTTLLKRVLKYLNVLRLVGSNSNISICFTVLDNWLDTKSFSKKDNLFGMSECFFDVYFVHFKIPLCPVCGMVHMVQSGAVYGGIVMNWAMQCPGPEPRAIVWF